MKRSGLSRTIVAIAMMLIGWLPSLAHDFEVDGVYYNKISSSNVEVSCKGSPEYEDEYEDVYLDHIVIPSSVNYNGRTYRVTSIGDYAFYRCYSLTSVVIPNSVTRIGEKAFTFCGSLTSIEIPNSVKSIGDEAFDSCSGLTSIEIPNSVTSIGRLAFSCCSSLTSVVIPNSVTSVGSYAFSCCENLTSIEIAGSVKSIGAGAFSGCESLTKITCWSTTPPEIKSDIYDDYFESIFPDHSIDFYVPAGCKATYKSSEYWMNLNIIELPSSATYEHP